MRRVIFLFLVVFVMLASASPASAEPWIDFFMGTALPKEHDAEVTSSLTGVTETVKDAIELNSSVSFGLRVGWWMNSLPWLGVALDFFHLDATSLGLNVMGRFPLLVSPEFKHGRVQPYVGGGPAVFFTRVEDKDSFVPANQEKTDTSIGVEAKTGVKIFINKNWAVFGEYRFTHHSFEVTFRDESVAPSTVNVESTVNMHHFGGGISFHFE